MKSQRLGAAYFSVSSALAVIACLLVVDSACATKFWKNSVVSGNWSNGNNWSGASAAGADNAGVPISNEDVNIVNADGVAHMVSYDVAAPTLRLVTVNQTGGTATNTLNISSGNNFTANALFVGGWTGGVFGSATNGRGAVNQTAGTVAMFSGTDFVAGHGAGSTGTYTLSGGAFYAPQSEFIGSGGTGTFNQSGGTNTIDEGNIGSLNIGTLTTGNGTYNLSGTGQLISSKSVYIGDAGVGNFIQTGGTVTINGDDDLYLGNASSGSGTYTISGNSVLTVGDDMIVGNNGAGTFNIQGGLAYIGDTLSIGAFDTVNLSGGALRLRNYSRNSFGTFNYTAGEIRLPFNRDIGPDATINALFGTSPSIPAGKALVLETPGTLHTLTGLLEVNGGAFTAVDGDLWVGNGSVSGSMTVYNGGDAAVDELAIGRISTGSVNVTGPGATLTVNSFLDVGQSGAGNSGTLIVQSSALVSTDYLRLYPQATVNLTGGTIRMNRYQEFAGSIFNFNFGTIELVGDRTLGTDTIATRFFGTATVVAQSKNLTVLGTATLQPASPVTLSGGTLTAGTLLMNPGSRLVTTQFSSALGPILSLAGSTIDATGGDLVIGDQTKVNGFYSNGTILIGSHTVLISDLNDAVLDSAALATLGSGANPGTLSATNGLTLDFGGNITGYGTITTLNNAAKPFINNGHIAGTSSAQRITLPGYVKGVGTLDNVNLTGTYSPGLSPTVSMVGNLGFASTSTLVMELGGTSAGSGYDQIVSSGQLAFDGILQLALINGFAPSLGQSFNLFDWQTVSGTFSSLSLPALTGGLTWNTSQLYATGVVSIASAAGVIGDYNNNGTVDAADYVVWRNVQGTSTVLPNDPTGGTIGTTQYNAWRAHFGQAAGSGAGSLGGAAVPEPASAALLFVTAASTFAAWRRRRLVASRNAFLRLACHPERSEESTWP